jgi:hypothetical protein
MAQPKNSAPVAETSAETPAAAETPVAAVPAARRLRSVHGGIMHDPFTGQTYRPEPAIEIPSSWVEDQMLAGKLEVHAEA